MNTTNMIDTTPSVDPLSKNNHGSGAHRSFRFIRDWAVPTLCVLAMTTLGARAERGQTVQEKLLIEGTVQADPKYQDGLHFVRNSTCGISSAFGVVRESAVYTVCLVNCTDGSRAVVSGITVQTYANGEQLYLKFCGTLSVPKPAPGDAEAPTIMKGSVIVIGGTGNFKGAAGRGEMTGMLTPGDRFSARTDLTLTLPGEK